MPEQIMAEATSPEMISAEVANSGQQSATSDISYSIETTSTNKTANSSAGAENKLVCVWESFQSTGISHNRLAADWEHLSADRERLSASMLSKSSGEASENEKPSTKEMNCHIRKPTLKAKKRQTGCESSSMAKRKKVVKANFLPTVTKHEENSGIIDSNPNAIDACPTVSPKKFNDLADDRPHSIEYCGFLCLNGVATAGASCINTDEFNKGRGSTPSIITHNTSNEEDSNIGDASDRKIEVSVKSNCSSVLYLNTRNEEETSVAEKTYCNQLSSCSGWLMVVQKNV